MERQTDLSKLKYKIDVEPPSLTCQINVKAEYTDAQDSYQAMEPSSWVSPPCWTTCCQAARKGLSSS